MKKACRKLWRVVPCTSRKNLISTESWKDIEEILKSKLATIKEEPEIICEEKSKSPRLIWDFTKMGIKKNGSKAIVRSGQLSVPQFCLKESYALFMARFSSKGSFGGVIQY